MIKVMMVISDHIMRHMVHPKICHTYTFLATTTYKHETPNNLIMLVWLWPRLELKDRGAGV